MTANDTKACPVCSGQDRACQACDGSGVVGGFWVEHSEEGNFLHVEKNVEPGPGWPPETVWSKNHRGKWQRWSWS